MVAALLSLDRSPPDPLLSPRPSGMITCRPSEISVPRPDQSLTQSPGHCPHTLRPKSNADGSSLPEYWQRCTSA